MDLSRHVDLPSVWFDSNLAADGAVSFLGALSHLCNLRVPREA
jgi:hypothetical protein